MVRNELWWWAVGSDRGILCVGCLEERIGRKLDVYDFRPLMINWVGLYQKSDRLTDRLGDFNERFGVAARRSKWDIRKGNNALRLAPRPSV